MFRLKREHVAPTEPAGAATDAQDTATAPAVASKTTALFTGLSPSWQPGDAVDVNGELCRIVWALVAGYANGEARITDAFIEAMPADPHLQLVHEDGAVIVKARR